MKIVHISAECYPIAKVGGLADVVGALPKYQQRKEVQAQIIMPFYDNAFTQKNSFKVLFEGELELGDTNYGFRVLSLKINTLGVDILFIDVPRLLFMEYVYSIDDTDRFLAFQIAALDYMLTWKEKPSIVHCHDHHTGLTPFMMTQCFKYDILKSIPTILTIHNAQYQGWFSHEKVHLLPDFNLSNGGLLDWDGSVNPLAAAIKCAWKVTTVSPSYMEELMVSANGLENLLKHESAKCVGILNGIDTDVWNPEKDSYLIKNYKLSTVQSGRKTHKRWLCKKFDLDFDKPLFAFIGRLVGEKGADLFAETFDKALAKKNATILLLGSGHDEVENDLEKLKEKYKGIYNAFIGYDERLSHLIYAGCDFLLMPSRVEPCGLNQMYALRYGAIPIVRSIGGLKDTVRDIKFEEGVGICHKEVNVEEMLAAIERGVHLYDEQTAYRKIRKLGMKIDHSWEVSANEYLQLYKSLN